MVWMQLFSNTDSLLPSHFFKNQLSAPSMLIGRMGAVYKRNFRAIETSLLGQTFFCSLPKAMFTRDIRPFDVCWCSGDVWTKEEKILNGNDNVIQLKWGRAWRYKIAIYNINFHTLFHAGLLKLICWELQFLVDISYKGCIVSVVKY